MIDARVRRALWRDARRALFCGSLTAETAAIVALTRDPPRDTRGAP
jgi:hypothetical protein